MRVVVVSFVDENDPNWSGVAKIPRGEIWGCLIAEPQGTGQPSDRSLLATERLYFGKYTSCASEEYLLTTGT